MKDHFKSYSSTRESRHPPRIRNDEWERYREKLTRLHQQNIPRKTILQILKDEDGFQPSLPQLNARFAQWRLRRYEKASHQNTPAATENLGPPTAQVLCEACRLDGCNCDGKKPICGFCSRSSLSCIYRGDPIAPKTSYDKSTATNTRFMSQSEEPGRVPVKGPQKDAQRKSEEEQEFLCHFEGCKSGVAGNGFRHVEYFKAHVQNYHVGLPEPTSQDTDRSSSTESQMPGHRPATQELSAWAVSRERLNIGEAWDPVFPIWPDLAGDELPRIDSGYSSVRYTLTKTDAKLSCGTKQQEPDCEGEIGTVSSAATTVDVFRAHDYVQELCRDIRARLQDHIQQDDWPSLRNILPRLIKTFALKLGEGASSLDEQRIMLFLHKRHREIFTELGNLFEAPALPKESGDDPERISLLDKMALWDRQSWSIEHNTGPPADLFDGVVDQPDREDEVNGLVELPAYSKVVLRSPAYTWLISTILRQNTLSWATVEGPLAAERVSQKVHEALSSGLTSKGQCPRRHAIVFRLLLEPIREFFREKSTDNQGMRASISKTRVITCTSKRESQASTIEDYFSQTWPDSGTEILGVLQDVMWGAQSHSYSTPAPDETLVLVRVDQPHIYVSVIGSSHSLAQYSQKLCWLASIFRPADERGLVFYTPSVQESSSPFFNRNALISISSKPENTSGHDENVAELAHHISENPGLDTGTGVETGGKSPMFDIDVQESLRVRAGESWFPSVGALCPDIRGVVGFPIPRRPEDIPGMEFGLEVLAELIGMEVPIDSRRGFLLRGSRMTLVLVRRIENVFVWQRLEASSGKPHRMSFISFSELRDGRHIWQEGEYDGQDNAGSLGQSPVSLSETNLENMSISSDSERPCARNQERPGFSFFKSIFSRLVVSFQTRPQERGNQVGTSSSASGSAHRIAMDQETPRGDTPSQKRLRDNEDEGSGNEDVDRHRRKLFKEPSCSSRPRFLACPFWKLDPVKHWECFTKRLKAISYVKQHLSRRHTPDFYCQRCFKVFAKDMYDAYDAHMLASTCSRDASAKLEGISGPQSKILSRKSVGTVEEQWFAMWRVLFPEQTPPATVYVDCDQSEDFCLLREFAQREGVTILQQELQARGLLLRSGVSNQQVQQTLREGLDAVFEHFRMSRSTVGPEDTASAVGSQEAYGTTQWQQRTPAGSSADSGIAVGSSMATTVHGQASSTGSLLPQGALVLPTSPTTVGAATTSTAAAGPNHSQSAPAYEVTSGSSTESNPHIVLDHGADQSGGFGAPREHAASLQMSGYGAEEAGAFDGDSFDCYSAETDLDALMDSIVWDPSCQGEFEIPSCWES
ncbi:hypothetical protein QBC47DRAFT_133891 [Echria macrotheca]|uniref:Zn(2)-C6 fungal-type domain-containing protein n=1 Tax=Echria macrotheca TaxID=438768 RepID=A0AAJ0BH51_9PEZI|nr:hypothetical protein QBC47DRAFT_133891 [Echria macrotheca]